MSLAADLARQLEQKRVELKQLFDLAQTQQVDPGTGEFLYDANRLSPEEVNRRNNELADLSQKHQIAVLAEIRQQNDDRLRDLYSPEHKFALPGGGAFLPGRNVKQDGTPLTLADRVLSSFEFKGRQSQGGKFVFRSDEMDPKEWINPELKSLFVSANLSADAQRLPGAVPFATRPIRVPDVIPQETTESPSIEFFRQTASAHTAATTVSESDTKPEATIQYTLVTKILQVIAVWIPITKQALDDQAQLRSLIEADLRNAVMNEEEDQILSGNGTSPNITGFLNETGVQGQARGSDNNVDAVYKAFTLVRWTGFAEPSAVIMHPDNWQTIRLMKDTQNNYIWGPPSLPGPETLWGKRVVITNAITANTALTGDFTNYSQIWRKMGIQIDIADQHSTFFIENKLAMRAEERMTLLIKRPAAFAKVTSLN